MARKKRSSEENIARRKLYALKEILKTGTVRVDELVSMYDSEFKISDERTIKRDVEQLQSIGLPIYVTQTEVSIPPMGIDTLWKGTLVGHRFPQKESAESRTTIAKRLVDFLKENKDHINTLMLGSGTTVYKTTMEILAHRRELHISTICTNSLLVLHAFVSQKPTDIELDMVSGRLDYKTASLRGAEGIKYLSRREVDAVVTSFTGLTKEGFRASQGYELDEKHMNLHPHERCKWVIIPLAWPKIDCGHGDYLVEEKRRENKPEYVIITDTPQGPLQGRDKERSEILEYWKGKAGVKVLRTSRAEYNK